VPVRVTARKASSIVIAVASLAVWRVVFMVVISLGVGGQGPTRV
jgi:hypothetical protein